MSRERMAATRFQLQLARQAASRGAYAAARMALRQLTPGDFAGGVAVTGRFLAILHDQAATDEQVRDAVRALVTLRPGGAL